jgi:hypothetical protein
MFTVKGQAAKDMLQRLNNPTEEQIEKHSLVLEKVHKYAKYITVKPKEEL